MDKTIVEVVLPKDETKRDIDALPVGTWFKTEPGILCIKISDGALWDVDNGKLLNGRKVFGLVTIVPYISVTASV